MVFEKAYMFNQNDLKGAINYVKKGWGFELWIANCKEYCGKLLFMEKGKKMSYHKHKLKKETFFCSRGKVILYYGFDGNISNSTKLIMEKGCTFHIPTEMYHRLEALEDSEIFEFSSQHFEEDSYRTEKGD